MKYGIPFLLLWLLTGCAHKNQPPAVSGNPEPVNSPAIIQELTNNV